VYSFAIVVEGTWLEAGDFAILVQDYVSNL
jgi:hypothetical protein